MHTSNVVLWIVAIATYGIGDTVTTYMNLMSGAVELNPFINFHTLIPLKISIFLILYIFSRKFNGRVPTILIILGLIGISFNLSILT